jgi:hypothetical protein
MFSLPGVVKNNSVTIDRNKESGLEKIIDHKKKEIIDTISTRNGEYFEVELGKLDKWGEDKRNSLKINLKELDDEIKELKNKLA